MNFIFFISPLKKMITNAMNIFEISIFYTIYDPKMITSIAALFRYLNLDYRTAIIKTFFHYLSIHINSMHGKVLKSAYPKHLEFNYDR